MMRDVHRDNATSCRLVAGLVGAVLLATACSAGGDTDTTIGQVPTSSATTLRAEVTSTTGVPATAAPTTTVSTTATTTEPPPDDAFEEHMAIVEAMIAARNSGDFDAWRAFFPSERPVIWAGTIVDESQLDWQRSYMAANEVWTITEPCKRRSGDSILCSMTLVNDFFGPAGIFYTARVVFAFNDVGEISYLGANSWDIAADPGTYSAAFDAWLLATHPDVHASFGPRADDEDELPNATDMPTALEYIDEFLAASDVYPVAAADG